jgi:hypothetical protein
MMFLIGYYRTKANNSLYIQQIFTTIFQMTILQALFYAFGTQSEQTNERWQEILASWSLHSSGGRQINK